MTKREDNGCVFSIMQPGDVIDQDDVYEIDWDVRIEKDPYDVYRIRNKYHTIGGKYCENNFYICRGGEIPTSKNLIPFDGFPVTYGIKIQESSVFKDRRGITSVESEVICTITRNEKQFCMFQSLNIEYAAAKAQCLIVEIKEHPINFNSPNFVDEIVKRKVWYNNHIPCIITFYDQKHQLLLIEAEDNYYFKQRDWLDDDSESNYPNEKYKKSLTTDIFDKSIYWFRNP